MRLVADRFIVTETNGSRDTAAIDLATGAPVMLSIETAGDASEQTQWSVRCDRLQRLHHAAIAPLLDFGIIGELSRFEAWGCGPLWRGSRDVARAVHGRAGAFLRASGLTLPAAGIDSVRVAAAGAMLPLDADAGYARPTVESTTPSVRLDACCLSIVPRRAVTALAEMFAPCSRRPYAAALWGPAGSGKTTALAELARVARVHGFVPIASRMIGTRYAELCRGRSLFIIDDDVLPRDQSTRRDRWSALLRATLGAAQPHVLLVAAIEEVRGFDGIGLGRLDPAALVAAVRPDASALERREIAAVRRAAAHARGCPGRFAQSLWPRVTLASSQSGKSTLSRAAESIVTYAPADDTRIVDETIAAAPAACTWPAAGELKALRARMSSALAELARGRYLPGTRHLRQAIGSLARRADWEHASDGALALASALRRRGHPRDAQAVLDEAQGYATRAGQDQTLVDIVTLMGETWTDLARLDEGEQLLGSAVAAARTAPDSMRTAGASIALARCLFWRGQYADAAASLGPAPEHLGVAVSLRHARLAARISVARRDLRTAMTIIADARLRVDAISEPGGKAAVAETAAFVHLAVGDLDATQRDVLEAISAAHSAHDPIRTLRARLLLAEAERRRGRTASAQAQLRRLTRVAAALPPILRARWDLLSAVAAGESVGDAVRRRTAATGLAALALYVPYDDAGQSGVMSSGSVGAEAADVVAILQECQTATDETTVLKAVCQRVREQLHAAAIAFIEVRDGRAEVVVSDGGRIEGDIAERAVAVGISIAPHRRDDRTEAAAPVRYGGTAIAALCARWTIGSTYDLSRAAVMLTMAAAAAAPAVSAVLARRHQPPSTAFNGLIGATPVMADLRKAIERAAAAPFAVLIDGESGSGKELVARAIHRVGQRRDRPFATLNCAALPDDLVESELFGHARGSFTGAIADRPGVFEEAHGGTLFLDEVGELSPRAQAKVLRVIQEGELRRIGENVTRRIDVRIVAATNRDLRSEVDGGRFRLDLLYRLDVVRLTLPPLRDRREDIAVLTAHIWRDATERVSSRAALSAATVAALARYDWPGNVRELQNVLAALAVRSPKRGVVPPTALPPTFGGGPDVDTWRLEDARKTFEERFVRAALVRSGGHRSRAADELGVTRQGLTKLMTRLGISD